MQEYTKAARTSLRAFAGLFVVLAGLGVLAVLCLWTIVPPATIY